MNQTIWKFETPFEEKFTLQIPTESKILSVQQDQKTMRPCIWILVYPDNPKEERFFELFGTGNPIHNDMGVMREYIGTYQYQKGEFVGHIFERSN
ncbi:hypothetical protein HNQ02_003806 [Flavobacterium sp. 7E]|uniref:DUF7352 domain-containing protein n=1 Tax=Flavobacterium sp. 7E TaxID=2735898 RepID=UPI00156E1C9A|nr:hypothetical protein [Flavobacterium sp. 7E]NRS90859.1 hypothetical protein [Flavobacterium sp. 7E]